MTGIRQPLITQSSGFPDAHVLDTLRRVERGESVGDINRRLTPGFNGRGSMKVAFWLRGKGYMRDVRVGSQHVEPYVMQGGFYVSSEPVWRGELTGEGRALLEVLEKKEAVMIDQPRTVMLQIPCAKEVLPMLLRGVACTRIQLDDKGDGTYDLVVHGPRGPLSDPFADVRPEVAE